MAAGQAWQAQAMQAPASADPAERLVQLMTARNALARAAIAEGA